MKAILPNRGSIRAEGVSSVLGAAVLMVALAVHTSCGGTASKTTTGPTPELSTRPPIPKVATADKGSETAGRIGTVGNTEQLGTVTVTLHSLEAVQAGASVQPHNGNGFLAIDVGICSLTDKASISPSSFQLEMPDHTRRAPTVGIREPILNQTRLPRDCVRGWVTFEAPVGVSPSFVVYDDGIVLPFKWDLATSPAQAVAPLVMPTAHVSIPTAIPVPPPMVPPQPPDAALPPVPDGSRGGPVPRLTSIAEPNGWEVKVLEYNADAWPTILRGSPTNSPPQPGFRMIMARVVVRNLSAGPSAELRQTSLKLITSDDVVRSSLDRPCGPIPYELASTPISVGAGESVEGYLCFQVLQNEGGLVLFTDFALIIG